MKDLDAFKAALQAVDRLGDGAAERKVLVDLVKENIDFDVDEAKGAKAEKIVKRYGRPGSTEYVGQLSFDGFAPCGYEPDRLITADETGRTVVEQAKARPEHKMAEAKRIEASAQRWREAERKANEEARAYSLWAMEQLKKRRKTTAITFDTFVRETGVWSDGAA